MVTSHNWERVKLSHDFTGRKIDAIWSQSVPNRMTEFLRFTVGTDEVVKIITGELLFMKIYENEGTEIVRSSRGLITGLAKRQTLAKEIVPFEYPYDIAWVDQFSSRLADNLKLKLPSDMPFLVFNPGSSLIFNILSTSIIPGTLHNDTRFSYHVYLFRGSYATYIEWKTRQGVMADEAKRKK